MITRIRSMPGKDNPIPPTVTISALSAGEGGQGRRKVAG
jgi:hypothetical protein